MITAGPGVAHVPDFKLRLVGRGQHEDCEGLRTDSPTCDVEGMNLTCSFAACNKIEIISADLRNAYFTAEPMDRLLLLRPPKGGLPGVDPWKKTAIAARVPIYGTKDAVRKFWKMFRSCAEQVGFKECPHMKSLYYYAVEGELKVLMPTHVDDVFSAAMPGYENMVMDLLNLFELKSIQKRKFRFCGREYEQYDYFSTKVTCKDNTEKILPINFSREGRALEAPASATEIAQMRSVIGSLAWIARQVRPRLSYRCSKLQSVVNAAQMKHLEVCNKILQEAIGTSDEGLFFEAGSIQLQRSNHGDDYRC